MSKGDKLPYGYSATVVTDEHGDICCYACGAYQRDGQICILYIADAPIKAGRTLVYDKTSKAKNFLVISKLMMEVCGKSHAVNKCHTGKRLVPVAISKFVVERTCGTMTMVYGLHRAHYLGIAKVDAEVEGDGV